MCITSLRRTNGDDDEENTRNNEGCELCRMDDISSIDNSMTSMNFEISDLSTTMNNMYNENQERDREFAEVLS